MKISDLKKLIILTFVITLAYLGISWLNWILFKRGGILPMPIWPAAGMAIASVYRFGWRTIFGLYIGALLSNAIILGSGWELAFIIGFVNSLGPFIAVKIIRYSTQNREPLYNFYDFTIFILLAVLLHPVVTATGGIGGRFLLGKINADNFYIAWESWWLAHAVGTVLFAPVFLAWFFPYKWHQEKFSEYFIIFSITILISIYFFFFTNAFTIGIPYFLIVPMSWVALRHSLLRTMLLFTSLILIGISGIVFSSSGQYGNLSVIFHFRIMAVSYSLTLIVLSIIRRMQSQAEEATKLRERALDSSPSAVIINDMEGRVLYFNHSFLNQFGYTNEESYNLKPVDLAPSAELWDNILSEIRRKGSYIGEGIAIRKDSSIFDTLINSSLVFDNYGKPIATMGSFFDISERKKTESVIRNSEEFRKRVFESSRMPIVVMDATTYQFIDCNPVAVKIYGYQSKEEVIGKTPLDVSARVQYDGISSSEKAAFYIELAKNDGSVVFEWKHERPGGEIWDAEVHLLSFYLDKKQLMQFSLIDITERKKVEKAIHASEAKYKGLFDNSRDGIVVITRSGKIIDCNNAYCKMLGYTIDELKEMTFYDLTPALYHSWERTEIIEKQLFINGYTETYEKEYIKKDGNVFPVEIHGYSISLSGSNEFLFGAIVRDITERKRSAQSLTIFKESLENSTDAIGISTPQGFHYYQNKSFTELFGNVGDYPPDTVYVDKMVGKEVFDVIISGSKWIGEVKMYSKNKQIVDVLLRAYANIDLSGNITALVGIHTDITERKKAELLLFDSERNYREIFNATNEGIIIHDAVTGEVLETNNRVYNLYGYKREEVLPKTIAGYSSGVAPYTLENALIFIQVAIKEGSHRFEWHSKRKNGELFWAEITLRSTTIGGEGRVLSVIRDITERKRAEGMMRLINYSMEKAKVGIIWIATGARIFHVNEIVCNSLGYSRQELLNMTIHQIDPDFKEGMWEPHLEELSKVGSISFESLHITKKGRHIPIQVTGNYIEFENQRGSFAFVQYISDKKLAEEARRKSEEQFRALAENSFDTIMRFDREHRHVYVNKMASQQTGIPVDKFIGKTHEELAFPQDLIDISNNTLEMVFKTGEVQRVEFKLPAGEWVDWMCVPEFGPDGKVQGVITTARDITERKLAEAALSSSERKFRELFNEAPVGYHEINDSGKIIKINNTELKMLGYEESYMLDHYIWDFIVEKEICKKILTDKLNGEETEHHSYELTFRRKDGSVFSGLLEDVLLNADSGEVTGIRTTVQDITIQKHHEIALHETNIHLEQALAELKETQKMVLQQERMRSLGQMASGIAHDINNSLSPIIGYTDLLLRDQSLEEKNRNRIILMKTAGLDIVKTIERMKEFYRPRVEQDEFQLSDLNMIIRSTIDLTRHKWKDMAEQQGKVIHIRTHLQEEQPKIWCHENEIREALTNLIINASDAMWDGGLITISCFPLDEFNIIEIIDEGHGMDEETLNHCMDPFYTTKGESGTGLGLSMVYGIMQRHQGGIKIESEIGNGTRIRLSFPRNEMKTQISVANDSEMLSGLKILCIDDNINMREMMLSMLQENKHNAIFASSGKMGLEIFQEEINKGNPFDLVITDLGMPYMDGKSVADSIKSRYPETPIILMTGWGAFIDKNSIKNVEFILKKPITLDEINKAIKLVVKQK